MSTRTIRVDALARVEGEGALTIRTRNGEVRDVELRIYEPPRFFEAFLRGRAYNEAVDITARICGICPVAYQMSACRAMEDALGIEIPEPIQRLRRILYAGEWIESHALHVFLLHAPDFLGYPDAISMARDHGDLVRDGLGIKKTGNSILEAVGGRAVHPINVRTGGFYRAPARAALEALLPGLHRVRTAALRAVRRMATFAFPDFERDRELVALSDPGAYPLFGERIVSTGGLDVAVAGFEEVFVESQVPHSNALHATIRGGGAYLCGPLARFALGAAHLAPVARDLAREIGLEPPCRNPFRSLLVRGVEIVHAIEEAIAGIERYVPPDPPFVEAVPRAGSGAGASEAPRGMLFHRYRLDEDGAIREARIVPPTSQNQKSIEEDLFQIAPRLVHGPRAEAARLAERAVRNHDPCISCATHFLDLRIECEDG